MNHDFYFCNTEDHTLKIDEKSDEIPQLGGEGIEVEEEEATGEQEWNVVGMNL